MASASVTFKGNPLTLEGTLPEVGKKAPDFNLVDNDLGSKSLGDYAGKTVVLSVVPSLDTPVCDAQTRRFNESASGLGDSTVVLTISRDLPFAQKRWCGAAGVDRVETLSDYKDQSFGKAYGLHIKELALLARAVIVVDGEGVVRYVQLVPEVAQEPDYDAVLAAVQGL